MPPLRGDIGSFSVIMGQFCVQIVTPAVLRIGLNVTELDTHIREREREKVKPGEIQIKPVCELIALCSRRFPRCEGMTAGSWMRGP